MLLITASNNGVEVEQLLL